MTETEGARAELTQTVAAIRNLRTPVQYSHPWFDPLDAGHLRIHRLPIELILRELKSAPNSSAKPVL